MKFELDELQVSLILDGLDALSENARSENRATSDPEIQHSNDLVIASVAALYEYIANHKEEKK